MGKILKILFDIIWITVSLSPVFILYFLKNTQYGWHGSFIIFIYLIICYKIQQWLLLLYIKIGSKGDTLEVRENDISNGSFIFIPTYIAFFGIVVTFIADLHLFSLIFFVTVLLMLKIKYIYFSPFLYLMSYSFYWVTSIKNQKYLVISKQKDIKYKECFSSLVRLNNFSYLEL